MDQLKGTARRVLAHCGLRRDHELLPAGGGYPGYSPVDRDDAKDDGERLLASSSSPGESETTACDKAPGGGSCGCACHRARSLTSSRANLFAGLLWLLGVLLILASRRDGIVPAGGTFGWSPVVDAGAVEYVEYTFPYFDIDPGQELWNNKPSYEQDVRWLESYNWLTRVPNKDAEKMPNGTIAIPGDEEHSVVWLGVFHELHCLNVLRKLVWYEYYSVHADLLAGRNSMRNHLIHCIDALRKGVMCHADVTPIPFWSDPALKNGEVTPVFRIPHTCRSYDRVRDWARANRVERLACEDEDACGALNAITMTVAPGDPQPTHWPDPEPGPAPAGSLSEAEKEILQCGKSVLDWCE